jgi:hypothetical protein
MILIASYPAESDVASDASQYRVVAAYAYRVTSVAPRQACLSYIAKILRHRAVAQEVYAEE